MTLVMMKAPSAAKIRYMNQYTPETSVMKPPNESCCQGRAVSPEKPRPGSAASMIRAASGATAGGHVLMKWRGRWVNPASWLCRWLFGELELPLVEGEWRRAPLGHARSAIGQAAERAAAAYLRRKGHRILCRNRANGSGELDLVTRSGQVVVFVEVRARTVGSAVSSHDAVGPKKLAKVRRTAELFLRQHRLEKRKVRLDVVAVEMSHEGAVASLEHFEAVA